MNFKTMKRSTKSNLITFGIVIAFYLVVQLLSAADLLSNSFTGQLVPICAYVILAISLNLTVGILGELSLGHAGFMSVGAFSGTLLWTTLSSSAPKPVALVLSFIVGGLVAGLFGFLVGVPVLRLSGDYLAIVTLAFGEIVKNVMNACYLGVDSKGLHFSLKDASSMGMEADGKVLINGAQGITGITKASTFTIGIVLVILTLAVILNLVNSRAGRAITSIRDNEIAARSVGVPITKYKLMAFVTSAVFAGVAGVLYSLNYSSLVAKKFDYNTSILILVFVVLGGIGNLRGSVIAAAILTVLPEMLRSMNDYRMLIYAIVLIVVMIFNQSPQMVALRNKLTARFRKENRTPRTKQKKGVA
ncbi:branched-chain amino acid ABC transporter permease [Subdoligranulum variabile]|uniref:branched-chain amino acid ABC transporter permease n=1 Tax=Subdoligranulum variabile TaxID=214851 RepID=UPI0025EE0250|nr:branched-chain amino acid ABC transporter permease [Subdoligranulum variabile]